MKINFFSKTYKLNHLQSEMLKVAIFDSLRLTNERLEDSISDTERAVLSNKALILDDLIQLLDLADNVK